jgi:hypothetical protein
MYHFSRSLQGISKTAAEVPAARARSVRPPRLLLNPAAYYHHTFEVKFSAVGGVASGRALLAIMEHLRLVKFNFVLTTVI